MFKRALSFLVVCFLFATAAPAAAQSWPAVDTAPAIDRTGANDVGIIVAVEDYFVLPDVTGALQNARDWEVFLRDGLGVPTVHVLANQDATKEAMLRFAKTAASQVGEQGTIWWIFIGHGAPDVSGKDGLLVGVDAQQSVESLQARGLAQGEVLRAIEKTGRRTVMVVDACFSGRTPDGSALAVGVQPVVAVDANGTLGPNSVVLSAAKATEVAGQLPGAERPAFSYLLLGAMRGWADDGDGAVTANEALIFARRELLGAKGRQQTPQLIGFADARLATGVSESKPEVRAEFGTATECPAGTITQDGECVQAPPAAGNETLADRKLEYFNSRFLWEQTVVRQGGRVLEGPAFYYAIDRPDLATKWRSNRPAMIVGGIALAAAGGTLLAVGLANSFSSSASDGGQIGWFFGGFFGGSLMIGGGVMSIVFGASLPKEPMSLAERKAATELKNRTLRNELELGPEVDSEGIPEPKKRGFFGSANPWHPSATSPALGLTVHF